LSQNINNSFIDSHLLYKSTILKHQQLYHISAAQNPLCIAVCDRVKYQPIFHMHDQKWGVKKSVKLNFCSIKGMVKCPFHL